MCLSSPRNNSRVVFNQHPRSYTKSSLFFFSSQKVSSSSFHRRVVESSSRTIMPSKTTSSADDGPVKKRPSAKEELERTMRRHETRADHVARDLGTRFVQHFPSRTDSFCVEFTKISFSLSFSLRRLSIKKLSAGKTRRKKSPSSPPRSFLASTEAF